MTDDIERALAQLKAAADPPRWKLLSHAIANGSFFATDAARIAELPESSGNARRTYADGLCDSGLLIREAGRPVRYRPSQAGRRAHAVLTAAIEGLEHDGGTSGEARMHVGDELDLVADLMDVAHDAAIVFTISRKA